MKININFFSIKYCEYDDNFWLSFINYNIVEKFYFNYNQNIMSLYVIYTVRGAEVYSSIYYNYNNYKSKPKYILWK